MSDSEDGVQCRSCLNKTASEYIHMESSMAGEYSYIECFNICTNLNANLDDGFPDFICDKCSHHLQVSFNFINEARMADAALRKNLPTPKKQIKNSALDEEEYVWTVEDEANLQKEDMFEVTETEFMDNDDYQELETCEDDLIVEDVKIEDEQMGQSYQLESTEQSVKDEPLDQLTSSQTYSEDEQNEDEQIEDEQIEDEQIEDEQNEEEQNDDEQNDDELSKECDENGETVKNFEANITNTRSGKVYRERNYTCIVCHKGYQYNINLRNHMRLMHREEFKKQIKGPEMESVRCEVCKRIFLKKNIEKHMLKHGSQNEKESASEPPMLLCAYCPKSFKNKYYLKYHELIHNPSRPRNFSCDYCDMKFFKNCAKIHHVKHVHSTERRFVCPVCGRSYKENNVLTTHLKTHEEKRFPCIQCERKYTRQVDLNVHMRSHTGELPYACHLCDKRFAIKVRLTYHLQDHVDAAQKCKICDKVFNNRNQLRIHKAEHSGYPYICEECPNACFHKRDRFRGHIVRHHKRTPSEEELTANFRRNYNINLMKQNEDIIQI